MAVSRDITISRVKKDLNIIPEIPGVYFFKDSKKKITYIGKAKSLRKRIKSHFSNNAVRKSKRITNGATYLAYQTTNTELTALLTEAELIKIHRPRLNVLLKGYGNNYFIKIDNTNIYERISIVRHFNFDNCDYFGPINRRESADLLLEMIDRAFQLRECADKQYNRKKSCYRLELERCLAPCIHNPESGYEAQYKHELSKVYDFLAGKSSYAIERLLNKMRLLSERERFEEAAAVRDSLNKLIAQTGKTAIISEPLNKAELLIEVRSGARKDYILMFSGKLYIKDHTIQDKISFETAYEDYRDKTIYKNFRVTLKDLERMKIALAWFVTNRKSIKIYYLRQGIPEITMPAETGIE
jgi:excinuclease UvrABC nuclease subunit